MQDQLLTTFKELHGDIEGVQEFFAPGRVNLIGEHTDYNGGHVFPCALTLGTWAVARRRSDRKVSFYSINVSRTGLVTIPMDHIMNKSKYGWSNYPLGMVWTMQEKGYTLDTGFDMVLWGNIPNGSGLSSSASLEVLTGVVIKELYGFTELSLIDIALYGQFSENNFNGMNCGIMDQFASAMGKKDHAILLDTSTLQYEYAPISLTDAKIVITNSKVKHTLVDSEYNTRRNECNLALQELQHVVDVKTLGDLDIDTFEQYKYVLTDPTIQKRAKHAVYENQRTLDAVKALQEGNLKLFGKLMNASHVSLRDYYEVSCPEVDCLVKLAWSVDGVLGSRITGGGFGGCTVSIVRSDAVDTFVQHVTAGYQRRMGKKCEIYIAEIGDGARAIV